MILLIGGVMSKKPPIIKGRLRIRSPGDGGYGEHKLIGKGRTRRFDTNWVENSKILSLR